MIHLRLLPGNCLSYKYTFDYKGQINDMMSDNADLCFLGVLLKWFLSSNKAVLNVFFICSDVNDD